MPRRNSGLRLHFLKKRNCYYIVWTERGRSRQRSTRTDNIEQAQIALYDFIERTRSKKPRDPTQVLITDILAAYAQEHAVKTKSPWRVAAAIKALIPFWEGYSVDDISPRTCSEYIVSRNLSSGTMRRELGVLRAAVNYACKQKRLTLTGAVGFELPEAAASRERWLSRSEAAALLRAALREPRVRLYLPLFILIGLYTGQRKEALLSLRWSQIDLDSGRLDFNSPDDRRTKKRRSRIPIPPRLMPHLRRARMRGTDLGFVINDNGKRIGDIKKSFASACRRAALVEVTPHVLRHTCATWLMQRGVAKWEAAGYLAMTQQTLERVYGHQHPEHLHNAATAFSSRPQNVRATGVKIRQFRS